ncbi:butyrophilin 2 [Labeo rohita]|uniref:Butyrophilin 2 n=1 Tax=Labeo rohita TaxID=84645 RepID=A0A498MHP8_LABRO|nr:butyrophilin 2 [Labeo rohita]
MNCVLMSVLLMITDGLIVKGPSGPLVAPLGSSVVLPCSVDQLLSVEGLEVEWRRTDSDTLVHLFQDGESQTGAHDYQDRAHFFTEEIQRGNFSLRLDDLRSEDEGRYTCTVHIQQESGETVVEIKVNDVERLRVSGSSHSISASAGEDVTLNCSVDSHITPEDFEEVSWKKTDEDEEIMVLFYLNNEASPEASDERYRDRVEFFTDEIPKGNFSLRLKSVRTEDKGVYMCEVFAGGLSANTTVELERLGFSVLHIMVLILCISACGSALLLFCLIYCRSPIKGSLFETVSCCALYFLRPLMLLWTAPYVNEVTGNIKTWVLYDSHETEYIVFSAVFYSVLFKSAWDKSLNYTGFERVIIIVLFVIVILFNLFYIIYLLVRFIGKSSEQITNIFNVLADITFNVLPSLQFILLFFVFGSGQGGFIIVAVLPVFLRVTNYDWNAVCGQQMGSLPRVVPVYVFGSVGVVLLNSVALMTELILKTVNGEGVTGDMRIVVFSSEFIFTLFLMILMVFQPWIKPCLQSCQRFGVVRFAVNKCGYFV